MPEGREAADTRIPGFPDPNITKANIRFQHLKGAPLEVTRPDSAPVKYRQTQPRGQDAAFRPVVDAKDGVDARWNWARLSSRENPLVAFTLAVQAAVGAFATTFVTGVGNGLVAVVALVLVGLAWPRPPRISARPLRFYRGFNNLRHSHLSREALATACFGAATGLYFIADLAGWSQAAFGCGAAAVVAGVATIYTMVRCYLIPARPFWNHWQTAASFVGATLALGGWIGLALAPGWPPLLAAAIVAGWALEAVGLVGHAKGHA